MGFAGSDGGPKKEPKPGGNTPKDGAAYERALGRMREEIRKNPEAAVRYLRQLGVFDDDGAVKKDPP